MERRSQRYNRLKEQLRSAGVFEDDMGIEEMTQIAQAMETSAEAGEAMESVDLERALLESEIDFQMLLNSTMITPSLMQPNEVSHESGGGSFERNYDSPPDEPIQIQVQAEVHRELTWSPTHNNNNARPVKRAGSQDDCHLNAKRMLQLVEDRPEQPDRNDATPISINSVDSGVSCHEMSSLSSISESSTLPSIGEMPSLLLISTSSAAVSDFSERDQSNHFEPA